MNFGRIFLNFEFSKRNFPKIPNFFFPVPSGNEKFRRNSAKFHQNFKPWGCPASSRVEAESQSEPHPESRTRTARVPGRQAAIHVEKDEGDRATAAANPSREKEVKNSTASRQDQLGAKLELNRKGALSIILLLDL